MIGGKKFRREFYHLSDRLHISEEIKTAHEGRLCIWRRGRDCSAFALPPRKPHPSLRSGPPCGRPARAAGGSGRASALNVRELTLACAATHHPVCCRTRAVSSTLPFSQRKWAGMTCPFCF